MERGGRKEENSLGRLGRFCLPKDKEGLGVKNIRLFKVALLGK